MNHRRIALLLLAAALQLITSPKAASAGDPSECTKRDAQGFCIEWDIGGDDSDDGDSGGGGGGGGSLPVCFWADIPPITDPTIYADFELNIPPPDVDIQWQEYRCTDGTVQFSFRWVFEIPPTETANNVRARIERSLEQPVIDASPPLGTASILTIPVFVAVANWTGVITESGCGGGICVTVTATPALSFDPAEPGSSRITCAGNGTKFDRSKPPAEQAMALGACAYAYKLRTGAEGRPNEWPGTSTVTWAITWTSTVGQSGVLSAAVRTVPIPRSVQEVQTVVIGGSNP